MFVTIKAKDIQRNLSFSDTLIDNIGKAYIECGINDCDKEYLSFGDINGISCSFSLQLEKNEYQVLRKIVQQIQSVKELLKRIENEYGEISKLSPDTDLIVREHLWINFIKIYGT